MFRTHKVLQGDLCNLPLPIFDSSVQTKILSAVEDTIEGKEKLNEIDAYIFQSLNITASEIKIIKEGS